MRPATPRTTETWSRPRSGLRRLLDVWGFCPGYAGEHREVTLRARDGQRLVATLLEHAPARPVPERPAIVLAHGFAAHRRKPAYACLAERLAAVADVLAVDLRGHGGSGGRCTFGDREALDVTAAAAWLRRRGHPHVIAVGASMGGAAVLRAAGLGPPGAFAAVCAISAPAQWGLVDSEVMRRIGRIASGGWERHLAGPLLRVRIARGWAEPAPPLAVVGRIAPTPVLLVHGEDDHFFGPAQAELLYEAAGKPRTLWREPAGFGHAEDGLGPAFCERLARAVAVVLATGAWPERDAAEVSAGPARCAPAPAAAARRPTAPAPRARRAPAR